MNSCAVELPKSLASSALTTRLAQSTTPYSDGGPPALLTHPEDGWFDEGASPTPAPVVLWFHGRTVCKELDAGRYLRWKRMGIAGCAIDLPGHGERKGDQSLREPGSTMLLAEQAAREVDLILDALLEPRFNNAFDLSRIAIGGMSAGGMVSLTRVCSLGLEDRFRAVVLEATTGDFSSMPWGVDPQRVAAINPMAHIASMPTVPICAVHSKLDQVVPYEGQAGFLDAVSAEYAQRGSETPVELLTWKETGAAEEHMGFGKHTNDTKNFENEFLKRWLAP